MPNLISIVQAATTLGVSVKTVRRMIARGDIRAIRVGPRLIRVDAEALGGAFRELGA